MKYKTQLFILDNRVDVPLNEVHFTGRSKGKPALYKGCIRLGFPWMVRLLYFDIEEH